MLTVPLKLATAKSSLLSLLKSLRGQANQTDRRIVGAGAETSGAIAQEDADVVAVAIDGGQVEFAVAVEVTHNHGNGPGAGREIHGVGKQSAWHRAGFQLRLQPALPQR